MSSQAGKGGFGLGHGMLQEGGEQEMISLTLTGPESHFIFITSLL